MSPTAGRRSSTVKEFELKPWVAVQKNPGFSGMLDMSGGFCAQPRSPAIPDALAMSA